MPTWTKVVAGLLAILGSAYACSLFFGWPGPIYVLLAAAIGAIAQLIVRGAPGIVFAFLFGLASLALPPPYFDPPLRGAPFTSLLLMLFYAPIIAAVAAVTVAVLRGDFRAMKRHGPNHSLNPDASSVGVSDDLPRELAQESAVLLRKPPRH